MAPYKRFDNYAFRGKAFKKGFAHALRADRTSQITNDYHGRRNSRHERQTTSVLAPPQLSHVRRQYGNVRWPNGIPPPPHVRVAPISPANPKRVKMEQLFSTVVSTPSATSILDSLERKFGKTVLLFLHAHWKRIVQELRVRFGGMHVANGAINAAPGKIEEHVKQYVQRYFVHN